jgi:hypothetical protein
MAAVHRGQTVERLRQRWTRGVALRAGLIALAKRNLEDQRRAQRRWLHRLAGLEGGPGYLPSDPPAAVSKAKPGFIMPRMIRPEPLPPDDGPPITMKQALEALAWITAPRDPKIGGR